MECRLCLNESPSKSIFSLPYKFTQTMMSLLNIHKDDGLPELICKPCVRRVKYIDDYMKKCEESSTTLRSRIVLDIKYEPDDKELKCEVQESENELEVDPIKVDPIKVEEDRKSDYYNEEDYGGSGYEWSNVKNEETDLKSLSNELKSNKMKPKIPKENKTTVKREKAVGDNLKVKKKRIYKKRVYKPGSNNREYPEPRLCPVCGMAYTNKNAYSVHLRRHLGEKFQCDFCKKFFSCKAGLRVHMVSHMPHERIVCRFCVKTFKFKSNLKRHEEAVHLKNRTDIKCPICGKQFFAKNYLRRHMSTHNGVRNVQCHICSKTFHRKDNLKKHLAYHSDDRPYVCRFCPKAFKHPEHRKKHERLHTGETPHRCPVCLKGFAQKCNMRSHFVHNHKELDFKETMAQFEIKNAELQQALEAHRGEVRQETMLERNSGPFPYLSGGVHP